MVMAALERLAAAKGAAAASPHRCCRTPQAHSKPSPPAPSPRGARDAQAAGPNTSRIARDSPKRDRFKLSREL